VIIDCLEFNRQLRLVDPFDEIAFLGMEAVLLGADWVFAALATQLAEALRLATTRASCLLLAVPRASAGKACASSSGR